MSLRNLTQRNGRWVVHGEEKLCVVGRDSFKLANLIAREFTGEDYTQTQALQWIEWNQQLLGEHVFLRVFLETGGWTAGHPMFGSPPADPGLWDVARLRELASRGKGPREMTPVYRKTVEWLVRASHVYGVSFELVVDATLKHTDGLVTATTDHAIRLTAAYLRELISADGAPYPNAVVILEGRNEIFAHNKQRTTLGEVNMWAQRFYRWKHLGGETRIAFKAPGPDYVAEQWPEGYIFVDQSRNNRFEYDCGTEPGTHKMGCIHPKRDNEWWKLPANMTQLRADCRGAPLGFNESMMYCDKDDRERCLDWYGSGGWTDHLPRYLRWLDACRGQGGVNYFIIHDEKGMQADVDWPRPLTRLEAELKGGIPVPSPDPEPPPESRVSYERIIKLAYQQILWRHPDPGGMANYQQRMSDGMTEAQLREALIRSAEYERKNPL